MNYGYARISGPKQNIERQIRNIRAMCPDDASLTMIMEQYSGRTQDGESIFQNFSREIIFSLIRFPE